MALSLANGKKYQGVCLYKNNLLHSSAVDMTVRYGEMFHLPSAMLMSQQNLDTNTPNIAIFTLNFL